MPFEKGKPRTGGRMKGTGNKVTGELRSMILSALEGVGGVRYLETQATASPVAFMALLGRILPSELNHGGQAANPIAVQYELDAGANAILERFIDKQIRLRSAVKTDT